MIIAMPPSPKQKAGNMEKFAIVGFFVIMALSIALPFLVDDNGERRNKFMLECMKIQTVDECKKAFGEE